MVTCECYVQDIIYDDPREGSSTIYYTCDNCRNRVKHKKNGIPGPNLGPKGTTLVKPTEP